MKYFNLSAITICFFSIALNLSAQSFDTASSNLPTKPVTVAKWQAEPGKDSVFLWPFTFADDEAKTALVLSMLDNQSVTKIQLVYTRYAYNRNFNQKALNQLRLQKLFSIHPEWFSRSSNIEWQFVEQTGCNNPGQCEDFFHGFAFYYVSRARTADMYHQQLMKRREGTRDDETEGFFYWFQQNINADGSFTPRDTASTIKHDKPTVNQPKRETPAEVATRVELMKQEANSTRPNDKKSREVADKGQGNKTEAPLDTAGSAKKQTATVKDNAPEHKPGLLDSYFGAAYPAGTTAGKTKGTVANNQIAQQYVSKLLKKRLDNPFAFLDMFNQLDCSCFPDCLPLVPECAGCYRRARTSRPFLPDGTVTAVMPRLQLYTRMDIVTDVTAGMLPPTAELMAWAQSKHNVTQACRALFYNDGDHTPDEQKRVGSTGGLYPTPVFDFNRTTDTTLFKARDRMFAAACHAITHGDGGDDVTENALEAGREAQNLCPGCDAHILIADNRSPVRDISLLKQLKYPLHIILPFVIKERGLINTEYLDIARKTHGSIHTKSSDYYQLDKMKDGEVLKVLDYKYKLVGEHFICIQVPDELLR